MGLYRNSYLNPSPLRLILLAAFALNNTWTSFHTFIRILIRSEFKWQRCTTKWLIMSQKLLIKNLMSLTKGDRRWCLKIKRLIINAPLFQNLNVLLILKLCLMTKKIWQSLKTKKAIFKILKKRQKNWKIKNQCKLTAHHNQT